MIQPLLEALQALPIGVAPKVDWKHNSPIAASPSAGLSTLRMTTEVQADAGSPALYISYAWGDDTSPESRRRGKIVEDLCNSLAADGWNVIRDRSAMRNGTLISSFIQTITRADRIIVVISQKYLHSEFCMAELHGIYQMKKNVDHLGEMDLRRFKAARDWHNSVGDILAHVSDVLHPHGFDSILHNDFAALKEMLRNGRSRVAGT